MSQDNRSTSMSSITSLEGMTSLKSSHKQTPTVLFHPGCLPNAECNPVVKTGDFSPCLQTPRWAIELAVALARMMLILLVVLWLLGVLARDEFRKDTKYVFKRIRSCPDVGYYFRREAPPNSVEAVCYLCFCQDNGTAVCWQMENKRCDAAHYQHGVGKRGTRIRRSPIGLSDIFFRDAARDLFNKQTPETCKPYETSFSEGCPPADWCTGCTVCDCDANGRWDCHILSFCPDKKDKNKLKTRKKRLRDLPPRRTTPLNLPLTTTAKKTPKRTPAPKKTSLNTNKKPLTNIKNMTSSKQPRKTVKNVTRSQLPNKNVKQIQHAKANVQITQKGNNSSPKPLIINKDTKSKNAQNFTDKYKKETDRITQEIYKKVVSAMQTFLDKRLSGVKPKPTVKTVQKRSMVKRSTKNIKNTKNAKKKVDGHFKPIPDKKKSKPEQKNNKKNNKPVKPNRNQQTKKQRNKRDIINDNVTETILVANTSYINQEVPVNILSNATLPENETITYTTGKDSYYKYSLVSPTTSMVTDNPEEVHIVYALSNKTKTYNISYAHKRRDKEKYFDDKVAIVLNSTAEKTRNSVLEKKKALVATVTPDFNDLKFNNWPQIKLLKNSLIISKLVNINSTKYLKDVSNQTDVSEISTKKYLKAKDVLSVSSPHLKKYNKSKIINTLSCNTIHSHKYNHSFSERIYHKIYDLQMAIKRVLGDFHKNKTTTPKQIPRKFNIIKYLKRYLGKVFRRNRVRGKSAINKRFDISNRVVDTICDNFINCNTSQKNNVILRSKIREINKESHTIIRTIKIIKGLLHLVNLPIDTTVSADDLNLHNRPNFKKDIIKLNAILKDKYTNDNTSLTSTQITQIKYIKNNTQLFVQSVGRFANTLNEIITILTKKHNMEDKNKHAFKTVKRSYENNRMKNETSDGFKHLKSLLMKYNLIQNTFVHNMYSLLSKYEKAHEPYVKTNIDNERKASRITIERNTKNIIENLKKLKNLAKMLDSRRQKREAMGDEDAIEYLLTLMEYLLKQNYPLDAAPVNDGIDLLIDAIKSAPDIKPIKKKILQLPVNIRISRTTEPAPISMIREDSASESRRFGDDSASNDTRSDTREHSSDQEIEKEDLFKEPTGNNIFGSFAAPKTEVYYDKGEFPVKSNQADTTAVRGIFGNIEETTEHKNFKKFEYTKGYEIFNSEIEEEEGDLSTSSAPEVEMVTDSVVTVTIPIETTELKLPPAKSKHYNLNSIDVSGNSDGEKRIGLDWMDEGYDDNKEVRQVKNKKAENVEAQTEALNEAKNEAKNEPRQEPSVAITVKDIHIDISSLTKEASDDEDKKKKVKINAEEVMFKKQMDLLNSLDYGTERSEIDETESKEGDERYSGDAFPSY